jgi:phosphoribosylaminoimidazole (AIR) synthetase
MALQKHIKVGGGYYKGYKLSVGATPGDYTSIVVNTSGAAMNGLSITPDGYGVGDTMKVEHFDDASGTGNCLAILAEDIHNAGANSAVMLDFPAAELVDRGESIKFTYTNTATVAMNVYLIAEYVGIKKTA